MIKNILIIGTGGFAAELTDYIEDKSFGDHIILKGYLATVDGQPYHKKYKYSKPYLGNLMEYKIEDDDYFVIAIANIQVRKEIIVYLESKKAQFINLIHPTAIIAKTAEMGVGNIIDPYCIIGPNVKIGNYNIFTSQTIISHDSIVGNNNFLPTSLFAGDTKLGDNNSLGIRCTSIPSIKIGNNTVIKAGMLIDKDVSDGETVFYKYKEKIIAIPSKN